MARALFVAALAFRLLLDIATPLLPGAYHFNPAESIEAHRAPTVASAQSVVERPTALPRVVSRDVLTLEPERRLQRAPAVSEPRHRVIALRSASERTPDASDDH